MEVVESGLAAQTFWKVAKKFKNSTLLEIEITTGRTHPNSRAPRRSRIARRRRRFLRSRRRAGANVFALRRAQNFGI